MLVVESAIAILDYRCPKMYVLSRPKVPENALSTSILIGYLNIKQFTKVSFPNQLLKNLPTTVTSSSAYMTKAVL
jgi:hypothetical protein